MDLGIAGRRAAVAAGSAGLGFGTAAALVAEGARVAICGRDRGRLDEAVARLGGGAVGIEADLSDPEAAVGFVDGAADALGGPLEILVANAGGPPPGTASQTDLGDYARALDLNFLSTVAMCNAAVGPMRAAGWGRIVAITSIGARQPIGTLAASSAARAAATSYVKNLSREVAPDGITANTVQPGSHDTERIRSMHGDSAAAAAAIPVGHLGDPADFGAVVAFLCSQPARFVTGAALIVDGGASAGLQ
jgi:3-oxoacyl-[acyl-carrier protein] reductase